MEIIADMDFSRGYGWRSWQISISVEEMDVGHSRYGFQ